MPFARLLLLALLLANLFSARAQSVKLTPVTPVSAKAVGFTRLEGAATGITFTNRLSDHAAALNQIRLNGSGVAAGDVDGDGLADLYFCNLEGRNTLYKNLGNWKFQDVTASAGVGLSNQFCSGALLADVEGDGDLDLLITAVGGGAGLFLNDGKGKFSYMRNSGLQRARAGTTMAMADFDMDGDLDLYVANYRTTTIRTTGLAMLEIDGVKQIAPKDRDDYEITPQGTLIEHGEADFLYENTGSGFAPVSWTGGRFLDEDGKPLAKPPRDWGLTAMFRDINNDGFPDLYVCNDFHSPDRIWINNGKGAFRAIDRLAIRNTSTFSMGIDFSDIDRDGDNDFLVVDMLDPDRRRRMVQIAAMQPPQYLHGVYNDRPQFDRNTLQLNRGDGTFAEIAHYAGIEASGWSWCPIFLDVDLDGYEDWLATSGHMFDTQDLDAAARIDAAGPYPREKIPFKLLQYPRLEVRNSAFKNLGNLKFQDVSEQWGFDYRGVSHGMVTADLDNDGDLDLVHNTLNGPAGVYRNESAAPRLAVRLRGLPPNTAAIGARITVDGLAQEVIAGGRYLSGADPLRVFAARGGKISVRWPNGTITETNSPPNRIVEIGQLISAARTNSPPISQAPLFVEVPLNVRHSDLEFGDFERQPLLPWKLSQSGPSVTWIDVDNDGWDELILPAGRGAKAQILASRNGFAPVANPFSEKAATRDQTSILGFDRKLIAAISNYDDGLAVGDKLASAEGQLIPSDKDSVGPIALADIDADGDLDLFVGGAAVPGKYPLPASSAIYTNQDGKFSRAQSLENLGVCNGAVFTDLNNDGRIDLALAMSWSPVRVFMNTAAGFQERRISDASGWWNGIATGDFDGDGDQDLVVSNWGLNSKYRAPAHIYFGDVDDNGWFDVVEAAFNPALDDEAPERELNVMAAAMPFLRERFPTFKAYGLAGMKAALGPELPMMRKLTATTLATTLFINDGEKFRAIELPAEAQFAPAFGISVADFDGNGTEDIFLAQNFFPLPAQTGRCDAGLGLLLFNDGNANFRAASPAESGLRIFGDQRGSAVCDFDRDGRADLAVGQNSAELKLYRNARASPGLRIVPTGQAIGAVIRLGNLSGWGPAREIKIGSGWRSQDALTQVMARPGATKAQVRWTSGKTTEHAISAGLAELRVAE